MDAGERFSDDGVPLRTIIERLDRDDTFALAVVMKCEGSTPRVAGTMALIDETGAIDGTIGGGLTDPSKRASWLERTRMTLEFNRRAGIPATIVCTGNDVPGQSAAATRLSGFRGLGLRSGKRPSGSGRGASTLAWMQ